MKKKIILFTFLTILILTFLSACNSPQEKQTLRIGSMPTQTASIYAVGIEKGFFEKQNLSIDLKIFSSAVERDSAATAKQLDGFLTDIMGLVNLKVNGFDYKITSSEFENFSLVTSPKFNGDSLKYLENKQIAISNNTVTEYVLDKFLVDNNLTESAVKKVSLPKVPERLSALISGNVEAGVFPEPFTSIIKAQGGNIITSSIEKSIQPVVFVFSNSVLENNSNAVENFYKAYNEIIAYMKNTSFEDYKDVLVKYGLVKEDQIDKTKLPLDKYENAKSVTENDVNDVISWMKNKKMISKVPSFGDLVEVVKW